jgi:hypothetical protein
MHSIFHFREKTIFRTFLMSAILIGITSAMTVEFRRWMENREKRHHIYSEMDKMFLTIFTSILMTFFSLILIRFLFGYGSSMLASKIPRKTFW